MEDDNKWNSITKSSSYFNPRPPYGGRQQKWRVCANAAKFQSTSPVWRTTMIRSKSRQSHVFQSTSPVWRTTCSLSCPNGAGEYFNPRPPYGGRLETFDRHGDEDQFQSTSPVWRTTKTKGAKQWLTQFQSTSPVWRTTRFGIVYYLRLSISIHVPRMEDDEVRNVGKTSSEVFQSTSPVWRTTRRREDGVCIYCDFNPRPPYGGRRSEQGN